MEKDKETSPVVAAEGAAHQAQAEMYRTRAGVEIVWRCPETGRWYTKKELADAYAKANNVKLTEFRKNG